MAIAVSNLGHARPESGAIGPHVEVKVLAFEAPSEPAAIVVCSNVTTSANGTIAPAKAYARQEKSPPVVNAVSAAAATSANGLSRVTMAPALSIGNA